MNNDNLKNFAEGFLTGFFDMVNTMLGGKATFQLQQPFEADSNAMDNMEKQFGGFASASISEGGAIAVLIPAQDFYTIAAIFLSQEMKALDKIAAQDAATLREVFEPCLGAGTSFFKEKLGKVLTIKDPQLLSEGLSKLEWDDTVFAAPFTYEAASDIAGSGMLLFAGKTAALVYPDVSRTLKQDEVNDILSAVGMPPSPQKPTELAPHPPNLEMILDIELTVKARLGRVEMPIGEILALGPGSIIDVGHMVDEPIELLVNDKLIARGDVVVVDEKFGLRITEIVSPRERIESLR